jgi:hypothetical protein
VIDSKALQLAQTPSVKKDFNTSGIYPGLGSTLPIIKWLTSSFYNSPDLNNTLKDNKAAAVNLCLSKRPLLVD